MNINTISTLSRYVARSFILVISILGGGQLIAQRSFIVQTKNGCWFISSTIIGHFPSFLCSHWSKTTYSSCSSLIQTQIIWSFISEIFHSLEMKTKCFFFKVYLTEIRGVRIWIPACLKTYRLRFDYVKPWIHLICIFSWQCVTIVIISMEKLVN